MDTANGRFFRTTEPVNIIDTVKTPLYYPSPRVLSILKSVIPQVAPEAPTPERKAVSLRHLLVLELPGGRAWEQRCEDAFENTR